MRDFANDYSTDCYGTFSAKEITKETICEFISLNSEYFRFASRAKAEEFAEKLTEFSLEFYNEGIVRGLEEAEEAEQA